jgi:hypothetical protein
MTMHRELIGFGLYLVVAGLWIYEVVDEGLAGEGFWGSTGFVAAFFSFHVAVAYLIGGWPSLALAFVLIVEAAPAGYAQIPYDHILLRFPEAPVFLQMVALFPVVVASLALGLLIAKATRRPHRHRVSRKLPP